jgi:hypothetical protein
MIVCIFEHVQWIWALNDRLALGYGVARGQGRGAAGGGVEPDARDRDAHRPDGPGAFVFRVSLRPASHATTHRLHIGFTKRRGACLPGATGAAGAPRGRPPQQLVGPAGGGDDHHLRSRSGRIVTSQA